MTKTLEDYLKEGYKATIFKDKRVLYPSPIYFPKENEIISSIRAEENKNLIPIFVNLLKGEPSGNYYMFGNSGTGKTLFVEHYGRQLNDTAERLDKNAYYLRVGCGVTVGKRRLYASETKIIRELAKMANPAVKSKVGTDVYYREFLRWVEEGAKNVLVVLDEIDYVEPRDRDLIIHNLNRANEAIASGCINLICISNQLGIDEALTSSTASGCGFKDIIFGPYTAPQLQKILEVRARRGFKGGVLDPAVIPKTSALAAQEHGDARKAIELLRTAGEIAEENGEAKVSVKHVDLAEQRIDVDRIMAMVRGQPTQYKAVLLSIVQLHNRGRRDIQTGEIFEAYQRNCLENGIKVLTQRRVSDILRELDTMGIITSTIQYKGRYGRAMKVNLHLGSLAKDKMESYLKGELY